MPVTKFELASFLFQILETVAAALRSVSVTEESLKAAKKALALEIGEAALQVSIFYLLNLTPHLQCHLCLI